MILSITQSCHLYLKIVLLFPSQPVFLFPFVVLHHLGPMLNPEGKTCTISPLRLVSAVGFHGRPSLGGGGALWFLVRHCVFLLILWECCWAAILTGMPASVPDEICTSDVHRTREIHPEILLSV